MHKYECNGNDGAVEKCFLNSTAQVATRTTNKQRKWFDPKFREKVNKVSCLPKLVS